MHDRALRVLAAALLASGFSPQEIREVTSSLTTDATFAERLNRLVDAIVGELDVSVGGTEKQLPPEKPRGTADVEGFLRVLEGIELTNRDLVDVLQRYVDRVGWSPSPRTSRRRIVEEFVRLASREAVGEALAELTRRVAEPDAYFDGIMSRRIKVG